MIANAGRSNAEILRNVSLLPSGHFIENFKIANSLAPLMRGLLNSLFVSITATALSIYFSTMVAYGFSVYNFKFKKELFYFVLGTLMIPGQLSFIGFYDMVKGMGLLNNYIPLIVPGIATSGTVFFLKQYCDQTISYAIIESARIDGAGEFMIFHNIILPPLVPAMSTMAIFTFIYNWNNYLTPLLILNNTVQYTLPIMIRYIYGVATLQSSSQQAAMGAIYSAAFISVIPVLIIFVVFSRQIISGLNLGSVKQ
jgi:multiple sugar transport system permease protein